MNKTVIASLLKATEAFHAERTFRPALSTVRMFCRMYVLSFFRSFELIVIVLGIAGLGVLPKPKKKTKLKPKELIYLFYKIH